jgi:hypothetical protein
MVSITPSAALPPGKKRFTLLNTMGLGGAAEPVWMFWRRRKFCPCQDSSPFCPAHSLVTVPTTLCWLIRSSKSRAFVWREYIYISDSKWPWEPERYFFVTHNRLANRLCSRPVLERFSVPNTVVGTLNLIPDVFVIFINPYRQMLGFYLD